MVLKLRPMVLVLAFSLNCLPSFSQEVPLHQCPAQDQLKQVMEAVAALQKQVKQLGEDVQKLKRGDFAVTDLIVLENKTPVEKHETNIQDVNSVQTDDPKTTERDLLRAPFDEIRSRYSNFIDDVNLGVRPKNAVIEIKFGRDISLESAKRKIQLFKIDGPSDKTESWQYPVSWTAMDIKLSQGDAKDGLKIEAGEKPLASGAGYVLVIREGIEELSKTDKHLSKSLIVPFVAPK